MWNVCSQCGLYRADKVIDPAGPAAICPECGHRHPFRPLPLFLVSGASGSGKSAVCQAITGCLPAVVALDADILWRPEFDTPADHYREFFETWLRMCKNIGQSGRPVLLFGAGLGVPANFESCIERRYFSDLHYLALTCDDETLLERLRQRPAWRQAQSPQFTLEQVRFNQWLKTQAGDSQSRIDILETTGIPVKNTVRQVTDWVQSRISS